MKWRNWCLLYWSFTTVRKRFGHCGLVDDPNFQWPMHRTQDQDAGVGMKGVSWRPAGVGPFHHNPNNQDIIMTSRASQNWTTGNICKKICKKTTFPSHVFFFFRGFHKGFHGSWGDLDLDGPGAASWTHGQKPPAASAVVRWSWNRFRWAPLV